MLLGVPQVGRPSKRVNAGPGPGAAVAVGLWVSLVGDRLELVLRINNYLWMLTEGLD